MYPSFAKNANEHSEIPATTRNTTQETRRLYLQEDDNRLGN